VPLPWLIITTHTTRHLRRTLLGVASESPRPRRVLVSCDVQDESIRALVAACSAELSLDITLVDRPHQNQCRLSQVRNNGLRAAIQLGASDQDLFAFIDGDCSPAPDHAARLAALPESISLVCAHRVELTPEQTESFDEAAVRDRRPPAAIRPGQLAALEKRQARSRRQAFLRRLGFSKGHKPKILGANFAVRLALARAVNGFDEAFIEWGAEDDDFSRRAYSAGARPHVGVRDIIVYHQHHPTRAPGKWADAPGVARFNQPGPTRCTLGLFSPMEQPTPVVRVYAAGACTSESQLAIPAVSSTRSTV
jgi:hypothetical protein